MPCFMGIDGGGSNLRVVITDEDLHPLATVLRGSVNPNVVGYDNSVQLIQDAMRESLSRAAVDVAAVGIGIAGAARHYAGEWLREVVLAVLPDVCVAAASDNEIALVGANGMREGVLVLAGTGSGAFGVNSTGESLQVGGWGYLLGDEGSGFWLGLQALRTTVDSSDGQLQQPGSIPRRVLDALNLERATDIIHWLYGRQPVPVADVAKLAHIVLEEAGDGDSVAQRIVEKAATSLVDQVHVVTRELQMRDPRVAFAGGLLESGNPLSNLVMKKLGLNGHPQTRYPPVVGAALLAKLTYQAQEHR